MASLLEDILSTKAASPRVLEILKDPKAYTAVIVDEPARYFYEESDKEYWEQREEFRNVAPPFEKIWMEFKAPNFTRSEVHGLTPWDPGAWKRGGVLFTAFEDHPLKSRFYGAQWVVEAEVFVDRDDMIRTLAGQSLKHALEDLAFRQFGHISEKIAKEEANRIWQREMVKVPQIMHLVQFTYGIEADGKLCNYADKFGNPAPPNSFYIGQSDSSQEWFIMVSDGLKLISDALTPILNVGLLSVYMMHAAGTELKKKQVPPKVQKARDKKRKAGVPSVQFKILDLGLGMRQSLQQARDEGQGLSRALHLRRGHFKTFKKPMFGREGGKTGDVWIRPHRVGSAEHGEVIKKYKVPKPKPDEEPPTQKSFRHNPDDAVAIWNAQHPVGSTIRYWDMARPAPRSSRQARVVSPARYDPLRGAEVEVTEPGMLYPMRVSLQFTDD